MHASPEVVECMAARPLPSDTRTPTSTQRVDGPLLLLINRGDGGLSGIQDFLEREAFEVRGATNDSGAVALAKWCQPDVVVLYADAADNGLQLMRHILSEVAVPVIIVAPRDNADLVEALNHGADDYMVEPAAWPEIAARARAAVRRAKRSGQRVRRVGALELDARARQARTGDRRLSLTPSEFIILDFLARTPGRVVSHDDLDGALEEYRTRSVAALGQRVRRLRSKLFAAGVDDPLITAVHGSGYRLVSRV